MTNFSTNQVMQFYVAGSSVPTPFEIFGRGISLKFADGKRSDIIENVLWKKLTTASDLEVSGKKVDVTVAGTIVGGANYILKVSYPEFGGGNESWITKTVMVQPKKGDAATAVATALKKELENTLPSFLEASVNSSVVTIKVVPDTDNYERGIRPVVIPDFTVSVNKVVVDGVEEDWATIATGKSDATVSGKYKLADMEYFALGERGDEYRQMGWPNVAYKANYKINPADAQEYDVLVVHYGYRGSNDQSHLSEKDLIIAFNAGTDISTLLEKLGGTVDAE